MAHLEVEIHSPTIEIRSQAFSCEFQDIGNNKKALFVFLRSFRSPESGKPLFTHETIANAFGYADRRNIQNYVGEFKRCGEDFQAFLSRTNTKRERLFGVIEEQVLQCPLLSPHQQYLAFCDAHPDERVSEQTFRDYVRDLDGVSLLKRVQRLVSEETGGLDQARYLQDVLEMDGLRSAKKKEIVETFPEVAVSSSSLRGARFEGLSCSLVQKKLLVVVLYACTLPQEVLARLFGVGKTSIHNWLYEVCSEEFDWQMLREIVCWSGRVSVDEKWVKIKGQWQFVLSAVDAVMPATTLPTQKPGVPAACPSCCHAWERPAAPRQRPASTCSAAEAASTTRMPPSPTGPAATIHPSTPPANHERWPTCWPYSSTTSSPNPRPPKIAPSAVRERAAEAGERASSKAAARVRVDPSLWRRTSAEPAKSTPATAGRIRALAVDAPAIEKTMALSAA